MSGEVDPKIEALDLSPVTKAAAYALKLAHPGVVFTSGRRGPQDQARAMASNVVKKPRWIVETYKPSAICTECQVWVDEHPGSSQGEIQAALLDIFEGAPDEELGSFSRHLSGDAFDVQPMLTPAGIVTPDGELVKAAILRLSGLDKFLDHEGGLIRWHAQFDR